jgi:ribosomal subunit interface protein
LENSRLFQVQTVMKMEPYCALIETGKTLNIGLERVVYQRNTGVCTTVCMGLTFESTLRKGADVMYTSKQINPAPSYFNEHASDAAIPVEVQFRHMRESQRVVWLVDQMMEKFEKYPLPGAKAYVVVDETHHREKTGIFQVKVKLHVPGERLYVGHSTEKTGMHDGVYSAIAEVFDSIEKQLVKRHGRRSRRRMIRAIEEAA